MKRLHALVRRLNTVKGIHIKDLKYWPAAKGWIVQFYIEGAGYTSLMVKDHNHLIEKVRKLK